MSRVEKLMADLERCPHCGDAIEAYARLCPTCGGNVVDHKIACFTELRKAGAISASVHAQMRRLLDEPDNDVAESVRRARMRKHVSALTPVDLERFPIWEFALDEEGEEGQDESTVRPRPGLWRADPGDGMFVVRAEFVAADGSRFNGFVSPHEDAHVAHTQPTIVTDGGQVNFWFGLFPPTRAVVEAAYRTLGKKASQLFPVRYRALVEHGGAALAAELPAFLHYQSGEDRTVAEIT